MLELTTGVITMKQNQVDLIMIIWTNHSNMNISKIMKIYWLRNGKTIPCSRKNFMDCKIRKVL